MPKVALSNASLPQLRDHASITLGLDVGGLTTRPQFLARISEATGVEPPYDGVMIDVFDQPVAAGGRVRDVPKPIPSAGEPPAAAPESGARAAKRVILIAKEKGPGGSDPVPVGVNGSIMLIPRGRKVEVPEPYVEVLRNAVQHIYDVAMDASGLVVGLKGDPEQVPLYPVHEFGPASTAA